MPEIDSITQEALKRASYMQSRNIHNTHEAKPPEPKPPEPKPPEPESSSKPSPKPALFGNGLDALFKDKETGVILILIILLMGEKGSENLLLALIYLLI